MQKLGYRASSGGGAPVLAVAAAMLVSSGCQRGTASRPDPGDIHQSQHHDIRLEVVTEALEHPWGLAFVSSKEALVSERPGRLQRIDLDTGDKTEIAGTPEVAARGQGGLLDVALHPEFQENRWVYLTYAAEGQEGGAATHLGRGILRENALEEFEVLHVAQPFMDGGQHFGSRIAFDGRGHVFYTVGDRGERELSQDRSNAIGTTVRLTEDGMIPHDNPFVGEEGVEPALYSYGHRNVQAMTIHPDTGQLWQAEHGPRGGDEVNLPEAGENFGWPLTSYGVEYASRDAIGPDPHEHEGTVAPIHYWEESFAPSGMTFYDGEVFPDWRGDLFIGALAKQHLARLSVDGTTIVKEEPLLEELGWRVRDVVVGPDDHIYLLIDARSAPMVRMVPAQP